MTSSRENVGANVEAFFVAGPDDPVSPSGHRPGDVDAPQLTPRRLIAGLLVLGGLAIAGIALGMFGRGSLEAFRSARPPSVGFLALGLGLGVVDIAIGALRILNLARPLGHGVTFMDCVRAELGNRCLAGITPWQTGGGGAQLYILARAGLPVSSGVALGSLNFLVSTVVLIVFGFTAMAFLKESLPPWLRISTRATLVALVVFLVIAALILGSKTWAGKESKVPTGRRLRRWAIAARNLLISSLHTARTMLREHTAQVVLIFPITIGIFATKIFYTWAVFRAFQPEGHVAELFGVLVILILSLFFAPTPGASGVAEASATAFLTGPLGPAASVGFVLYWRMLTLYLPVVLGGLVLLHQLGRDSKVVTEDPADPDPGPGVGIPKSGR